MNEQVSQYITKAPAKQREIMESIRQIIHEEAPSVTENIKWSRPVFSEKGDFMYFKTSKEYLTVGIFKFTRIKLYNELLEGTGKNMRHIKLRKVEELKPEVIRTWIRNMLLMLILVIMVSCKGREDIMQFAAIENYPEDTILKSIDNKRAMIVIAHDDDMCAMAGTASLLNKNGWDIAVVSFSKSPERNAAQKEACKNIIDEVLFVELSPSQIRNDNEAERKSYYAFPKDSFDLVFNKPIIETEFEKQINEFKPAVIFTLDNEMGGYGHPEHVLISQMVIDLTKQHRITPLYIYQSVFTDHMENSIMHRHSERMKSWGFPGNEWDNAKKIYGTTGMPQPTVQITITSEAEPKMDYLRSYNERERKTLGFFIPEFEKYSAEEYFKVFNREFYRIIKI